MGKILLACIGVLFFSFSIGLNFQKDKINMVETMLFGFLTILGVMEVVALPCTYLKVSFAGFSGICAAVYLACALLGWLRKRSLLFVFVKDGKYFPKNIYFVLALICILGQMAVIQVGYHTDEDDAFYVATATTTLDTNTLFVYDAYTGEAYSQLPARYVLSPFPFFTAFVGKVFGLRPVVVAHTLFAALTVMMAYGALWLILEVFIKEEEKRSMAFAFASVLTIFSYYSTRITTARLLLRPWQGKTVLASVVLPMIFYFGMRYIQKEKLTLSQWGMLMLTMLAACLTSSMGMALSVVMLGCLLLVKLFVHKNIFAFLQGAVCCIPAAVLSLIYIMIR